MLDLQKFNCCGCAACANICPKRAIIMKENNEGFYIPFIDIKKCTNCDLCSKRCPQLNSIQKNTKEPKCYAAMAPDELREKSSSGGAFGVIADEILKLGGVIVGAAFDENWVVNHIIVDNKDDLEKLRGSKYVQSFVSEQLMRDVKEFLNNSCWVLFTGTPCQVAGLKSFLGKDYNTLLTVDIICSKVPSNKVFNKFLIDNYDISQIKNILFRDKNNGWNCSTTSIMVGKKIEKQRDWFDMYLNSLSMNESCIACKYMSIDRIGDITIGDFWGISKIVSNMDDKKGTSCILLNTKKGEKIFKNLKWKTLKKMTAQNAIDGNRALLIPFIPHQNRNLFTNKIMYNDFDTTVKDSLSTKYNVGILNWWWNSNRGAILTCYAIQEVVKDLGYNPSIIMHIPFDYYNNVYKKNSLSKNFAEKYLNLTHWCHSRIDMRNLNKNFETFMVGSDQVWNYDLNWFLQDFYYLNFAELNKNKIACAASFGSPKFKGNTILAKMVEYYFKRFNHISVREQDAVDLLKNSFDVNGSFILDPVFLIDKSKYEKIIKDSTKLEKNYIAYYFIHNNPQAIEYLNMISKKMGLPTVNIKADGLSVEDWLYYIKNSELVVSDSFHASCFSILFNKKFITLSLYSNSRFDTLKNITNLENRFVLLKDFDINSLSLILKDEDWESIDKKIEPQIKRSLNWLKNALEDCNNNSYSKEQEYLEAFYASMDDRINLLESQNIDLIEQLNSYKYVLKKNKKNLYKYRLYRFLSGIIPSQKLKDKKQKYKQLLDR